MKKIFIILCLLFSLVLIPISYADVLSFPAYAAEVGLGAGEFCGFNFTAKTNFYINSVTKYTGHDTLTGVRIYAANHVTILNETTYSGDNAVFTSPYLLLNNTVYYIAGVAGASPKCGRNSGVSYPVSYPQFNALVAFAGPLTSSYGAYWVGFFSMNVTNYTAPPPPSGPVVSLNLLTPSDGTLNNSITNNFYFNNSLSMANVSNFYFWTNYSTWKRNQTNTTALNINGSNYFTATLPSGVYLWGVELSTTNGTKVSSNFTLKIDATPPVVSTSVQSYYTRFLNFQVNVSDTYLKNITIQDDCNLFYNNDTNISPSSYSFNINISNCTLGLHNLNVTSRDTFGQTTFLSYNYSNMASLNVTAKYLIDDSPILNFVVYANGTQLGNTTNGYLYISNLTQTTFNLSIDAVDYSLSNAIVNINQSYKPYQFVLDKTNALLIYIKDEATGFSITSNVTIRFTTSTTEFTNITNSSTFYIYGLEPTEYTLTFTADLYNPRTYIITIGNRTSQTLTAYLASGTDTTLFSISDKDTSAVLSGVTVTMYGFINSTWTPVQISETDITGRTELTFVPYNSYKFYLVKEGYDDYIFYLNPILFDSYNIKMSKVNLLNYSVDFDGIDIIFNPQTFYNNQLNNFTFIISSPGGSLISYGITLTYPTGTDTTSGTNAIGGQLFKAFTITNAAAFDTVTLNYYYETTIAGRRNFTYTFPIITNGSSNSGTFMANKNKTYGLGLFERILVSTLITLFVVGFAALIGQVIPGIAMGLIIMGYMVLIGFIPIWLVLPTMFIGILFLMKAGGNN